MNKIIILMQQTGTVICRLPGATPAWGIFSEPEHIIAPRTPDAVIEAVEYVERCLDAGMYVAGFIAYEAAVAFDVVAETKNIDDDFPFAWFAVYSKPPELFESTEMSPTEPLRAGEPELSRDDYSQSLKIVREELKQGNIYQANFTFRTHAQRIAEPERFFLHLFNVHPAPYAAFINTGDLQIISNSPELFWHKTGSKIISSPMKGTARRHPLPEQDRQIAEWLPRDPKNRAENLMITDMVRNDLGRVCKPGTVHTEPLFQVNTYNTLHQMVSTVSGELEPDASLQEILNATFPPASITGAPKLSAMSLIKRLEKSPRKLYTGSIGAFMPNGDCCLNVAIRTLINSARGSELGVGGGIVYDSETEDEWHEALLKSRFARFVQPEFELLETMLYEHNEILWFDAHLDRVGASQQYFNRPWNRDEVTRTVNQEVKNITAPCRIRLLLDTHGKITLENYPLNHVGWGAGAHRLKISPLCTNSKNLFLYHKTTLRDFYNRQFAAATANGFAEVVFANERNELTEGSISSIFIQQNGQWRTPALECGLLPGIWRQKMIKELDAEEAVISIDELHSADKIIIGNSVRGKVEITELLWAE
ncbi:MAG: aminodeoxychorismate synthase component I [Victivallaceae bacterium]|nr:aminodeoxychorismate synthase component I [Victivallaceae bacterium]